MAKCHHGNLENDCPFCCPARDVARIVRRRLDEPRQTTPDVRRIAEALRSRRTSRRSETYRRILGIGETITRRLREESKSKEEREMEDKFEKEFNEDI